jgi:hypothetical protein
MVQGPCAHLHLHETATVVLDRLNVISSGGVSYHHVAQVQKDVSKGTSWRQYSKSDQVEIW